MTADIESSQVLSKKNITRAVQGDGSIAETTTFSFADGTMKEVSQVLPPDAATTASVSVAAAPTSTTAVPMGSSVVYVKQMRTSRKATASMWCGIVCTTLVFALQLAAVQNIFIFGLILGPIAICLGVSAKKEIAANRGTLEGTCQANAGISCGAVSLVLWLVYIIIIATAPAS